MADLAPSAVNTKEKDALSPEEIKQLPNHIAEDFEAGEIEKVAPRDPLYYGLDDAYVAKAQLFSDALTSIGMTE